MNETDIIRTSGIKKVYGGTIALAGADLSFRRGEVHALAGENGAGKSTFCKILSGAIAPTEGTVYIDGTAYRHLTPSESRAAGISMIYQEFNMVNDVPVYENIFIGSEIRKQGIIVDKKEMIRRSKELFAKMDVDIDPRQLPRNLSVAQCQLVEIAKALKDNCKVLVMDEPTAALTNKEIGTLLDLIKRLKEEGITIIYISHRMDEIMTLSDRVSIMRDGHVITTLNTAETTQKEIITLMVGRELTDRFPPKQGVSAPHHAGRRCSTGGSASLHRQGQGRILHAAQGRDPGLCGSGGLRQNGDRQSDIRRGQNRLR